MLRLDARFWTWPLTVAAALSLLLVAVPPGQPLLGPAGLRLLLLVTSAVLLGSLAVPLGGDLAFGLLWTTLGLTLGAALLCVMAVSLLPLLAYALVIALLVLTPNRTGQPSRIGARTHALFLLGLGGAFLLAVLIR